MKLRRMKLIEICFVALFVVILLVSILFATVLDMPTVSIALFLVDFPVALIVAFYGSLSIREEEEEKSKEST